MKRFNYEKYVNDQLITYGISPAELTEEQKYLILEPMEAPENYYCDGEITPRQAYTRWYNRLIDSGLPMDLVHKARQLNDLMD
jgi:predicted ATP-dependent Lon-type protease